MRYIVTFVASCMVAIGCFAQSTNSPDNARQAPMPVQNTNTRPTEQRAVYDNTLIENIRTRLDLLEETDPNYAEEIDISVGRLPLAEFMRNVAKVGKVNLSIRDVDNLTVAVNFSRAKISELIYFLCKEYNLDVDITGNIVSIFPRQPKPILPKEIKVSKGSKEGTISYDLERDNLVLAVKKITDISGVNIVVPQNLYGRPVSGFVKDLPVDEAVTSLAGGNDLGSTKNSNGIWEVYLLDNKDGATYTRQSIFEPDQLLVDSMGLITARITQGNVHDIITDICTKKNLSYYFTTPISHQLSLFLNEVTFETLLGTMFAGTKYGYYSENDIYIFGSFSDDNLNSLKVIPLMYRSVSKIDQIIPKQFSTGLEIQTFVDQNSIIVSGDQRKIQRIENFIGTIDKRVPLVTIEVMIVDVTRTQIMETGLGLGVGDAPVQTTGKLSPGVDMTLGASSVNSIINSFSGFGSVNLGKVTPQFYMTLKMLEDDGKIQIYSTPKLSTLNGNPASLKSGEKSYYKEITTNYWGSQTPTPSESFVWKEVEANLEINITPFVSADKQITLDINIVQSEFTERIEKDGPPGIASRSFKSIIRVQHEDMVLLGGIDRNSKTKSSSGLPFIARVPILKWIFGSAKDNKIDHKLNVFIKPTLID